MNISVPEWLPGLRAGAEHFDAGRFWHAHEDWEREWKAHPGAHRHYLKGLIQLTAACHHLARGKPGAARALLDRYPRHLCENHPLSWPLDTAHLVAVAAALAAALDRGRHPRPPPLRLLRMIDAWMVRVG